MGRRLTESFLVGLQIALAGFFLSPNQARAETTAAQEASPIDLRPFEPMIDGKWIGQGIAYGPYREGQAPGGASPSREQLLEDLQILVEHWQLLRMYGADQTTEEVLKLIREKKLPMRVMIGAWIAAERQGEQTVEAVVKSNAEQADVAIRLANAYPDVVIAVSVGNETQVFWSGHRTRPEVLIKYIRKVREATKAPVTTADDFNFWNKPESQAVADEIDFIVTHIHAHWAGLNLDGAMSWTKQRYQEIAALHPQRSLVLGEAGWATTVHDQGEQARLIKGVANEEAQRTYYRQFTRWAEQERICTFYFEAFDEPWKGGPHPNEVEKHWGLYGVDRQPKAAMQ